MLNNSLILASIDDLKNIIFHGITIFHVALVYVLMYVVYKALGRYLYFKPQEHASKINRTFLTVALFIVLLHVASGITVYLPILPEYRWLFISCGVILIIAILSIVADRIVWKYDKFGQKKGYKWHYDYLRIKKDYYKTSITKSETKGYYQSQWEEEAVESTEENIHSDALINTLALVVFVILCGQVAFKSSMVYGIWSYVFVIFISLAIVGLFLDHAVFAWIRYLENALIKRKKAK